LQFWKNITSSMILFTFGSNICREKNCRPFGALGERVWIYLRLKPQATCFSAFGARKQSNYSYNKKLCSKKYNTFVFFIKQWQQAPRWDYILNIKVLILYYFQIQNFLQIYELNNQAYIFWQRSINFLILCLFQISLQQE